MRQLGLILLLFAAACQAVPPVRPSGWNISLAEAWHPDLLSLQAATVAVKSRTGKWPTGKADLVQQLGDSAEALLTGFRELDFQAQQDTLHVTYQLGSRTPGPTAVLSFSDTPEGDPTTGVWLKSHIKSSHNRGRFQEEQWRFLFVEGDDQIVQIMHEFPGGMVRHQVKIFKP